MRSVQKVKAHQEECITRITCKNELYIYWRCEESYIFFFQTLEIDLGSRKNNIHCLSPLY